LKKENQGGAAGGRAREKWELGGENEKNERSQLKGRECRTDAVKAVSPCWGGKKRWEKRAELNTRAQREFNRVGGFLWGSRLKHGGETNAGGHQEGQEEVKTDTAEWKKN